MRFIALALLPALTFGSFTKKPTQSPSMSPSMAPTISKSPSAAPTVDTYDCPRLTPGQEFVNPVNISSRNGYLGAYLNFRTLDTSNVDVYPFDFQVPRFCYMINSGENAGEQAPVLRTYPGETMLVTLTNDLPRMDDVLFTLEANDYCLKRVATSSSTNMHFHGFHAQPVCHDDNVMMTIVNSGDTFTYAVEIPTTQPPGLYWYHPHIHLVSDNQVGGGASGVIVVEGIENVQPEVAGLPEQIMVFRRSFSTFSLNFIPILDAPATLRMKPLEQQFWRIANTMADNEMNITLIYDGVPQNFRVIALDGVSVGVNQTVQPYDTQVIFIPAGGRAEVVVTGPDLGQEAFFMTVPFQNPENGDPFYFAENSYQILRITADEGAASPPALPVAGTEATEVETRVPENLLAMQPAAEHTITFYQEIDEISIFKYFLNVDHGTNELFDINTDPVITSTQGTVEDWTLINNTTETHDFHIHQMHFLVLEIDGVPVPVDQRQYLDTLRIPQQVAADTPNEYGLFLTTPHSYKVRMDFTGDTVGKFVFHCHVLFHEDHGMMRIVEVLPNPDPGSPTVFPTPSSNVDANDDDDNHRVKSLIAGIAVLAAVVGVLIIVLLYYCIFHGFGGNSGVSAPESASPPAGRQQAGHQPLPTSEGMGRVELAPAASTADVV